jgi:GT2 family glycosyltransferase
MISGCTGETAIDNLSFPDEGKNSLSRRDNPGPLAISIVVVSYNTKEALRLCIRSIYEHPFPGAFEVIVVDNASSDGSPEMVGSFFPEVRLLRLDSNRGYAAACNCGAKSSTGRMLLFLNSDIEVTPGALKLLHDCVQNREAATICGGRLEGHDGSPQPSCRRFPNHFSILFGRGSVLSRFRLLKRFRDRYIIEPPEADGEVDSIAGACLMIKKGVFEKLAGFDERFFMYVEDMDLCYRLKGAGGVVLFASKAVFKHRWGASSVAAKLRLQLEHHRSIYRYFRKHYLGRRLSNLLLAILLLAQLGSLFFLEFLNLGVTKGKNL